MKLFSSKKSTSLSQPGASSWSHHIKGKYEGGKESNRTYLILGGWLVVLDSGWGGSSETVHRLGCGRETSRNCEVQSR